MSEQRKEPRHKTLLRAEITTADGAVYDCSVRDLSATGARLSVGDLVWIPDRFKLNILTRRLSADAEVRWRDRNQVGVCFRNVTRKAAPAGPEQDVA